MSRQQTRSSGDGAIDPSLVQKKRARHRLVGAICLCLLAAIVVPLVLESEPRPRESDLPIELAAPSREAGTQSPPQQVAEAAGGPSAAPADAAQSQSAVKTVTPPGVATLPGIAMTPPGSKPAGAASGPGTDSAVVEAARTEAARAEAAKHNAAARQEAAARTAPAKPDSKSDVGSAAVKPPAAKDKVPGRGDEPDVLARLIDRTAATGGAAGGTAAAASGAAGASAAKPAARRFLVQIGAYSNVQSARSVSDRAVQAGLRPYQETVKTAQGDWIRVRVGPFTTRQDAERAQQDLKRAGVTAAIIAL
jgi:DedD protein